MNHLRDGSRSSKKAGSDNGAEFTGADIDALMTKYGVTHEYGIKGCPMSQSLAESHVGVWKRRFASYVRARMDAIGEEDEDSKSALEIKQSWPDLAATITSSVNSAWMQQHPRPLSRIDVHYGDSETIEISGAILKPRAHAHGSGRMEDLPSLLSSSGAGKANA